MSSGIKGLAVAAIVCAAVAGNAQAQDLKLEAETLASTMASGGPWADSAASAGKTLAMLSSGASTGVVTTSSPAVHLAIVARGTQCDGAPVLTVFIDGKQELTAPVGSPGYTEYGADLYLAAGTHAIRVVFVNDYRRGAALLSPACDRNVFLDTATLYDRPFAEASFAATPLVADAPVDPESDTYVQELQRLLDYEYDDIGRMPVDTSTGDYSVPVYTVRAGQPTVKVNVERAQYDPAGQGLEDKMKAVPLPDWAAPSQGSDHMLVVWQPSSGRMWEMWNLRRDFFKRWTTLWGGYVADVHRFPAHFGGRWPQTEWGAAASKIELLAGLQRIDELRAGIIDHAVSVHLPAIDASGWRWPAQGTDPRARMPGSIREGMRFRLPEDLDLDALGLSPYARIVARAVQRYGMVVTDHSDRCICFVAEDPSQYGSDPYRGPHGIFGGDKPDFTNFPWAALQLVAVPADAP